MVATCQYILYINSSNYVAMYGGTLANFLKLQMWRLYRKFNNRLLLFYQEVAYAQSATTSGNSTSLWLPLASTYFT